MWNSTLVFKEIKQLYGELSPSPILVQTVPICLIAENTSVTRLNCRWHASCVTSSLLTSWYACASLWTMWTQLVNNISRSRRLVVVLVFFLIHVYSCSNPRGSKLSGTLLNKLSAIIFLFCRDQMLKLSPVSVDNCLLVSVFMAN